ncbi:restriction endonuclease [Propionispira raffinosivorans]|uniref:restriction endonuclease n=1 Tax=Propionispira raffinosivorans TaxID=86959 RepID=UPI000366290A|nr:restriction endonuclease [Propionispira raffinosivorans]
MAIPTYEDIMLPFLQHLSDGQVHTLKSLQEDLSDGFNMTEEEKNRLFPSGRQNMFYNRLGWARTYLKKSLLINAIISGHFQITQRGLDLLAASPRKITNKLLGQYSEFVEFKRPAKEAKTQTLQVDDDETVSTPREQMDESYQAIQNALADDLLQKIAANSPPFFEQLVLDVLLKMGYGGSREDAAQVVGKTGDEGIDGIIKEDRLGLDVIYVQAKRWKNSVGSPDIQTFIGALQLKNAQKGIFITTSTFTQQAKDIAARVGNRIVLIDGMMLAQLMIEFGVGVSSEMVYDMKRLDLDYFEVGE